MIRREFLMLAKPYVPNKHDVQGWYASEKLDGIRAWWDGGCTRGMPAHMVPWANTAKDARLRHDVTATGLWTRYGKVIRCPPSFTAGFPPVSLDGELYLGRRQWQELSSIVRSHEASPARWEQVRYMVFDAPPFEAVLGSGTVNTPVYKHLFSSSMAKWCYDHGAIQTPFRAFETQLKWLNDLLGSCTAAPVEQLKVETLDDVDRRLDQVVQDAGEGLMLRKPRSFWEPKRSSTLLKVKPFKDSEARVVGYVWGRRTELGSKLLGLMGALIVEWASPNGLVRFELSGFTDAERDMIVCSNGASIDPLEGQKNAGQRVSDAWRSRHFEIGSLVTFRYRELSDSGVPKEARYWRLHTDD